MHRRIPDSYHSGWCGLDEKTACRIWERPNITLMRFLRPRVSSRRHTIFDDQPLLQLCETLWNLHCLTRPNIFCLKSLLIDFKSSVLSLPMDVFSNGSMALWNLTDFTAFKRWVMESSEWPVVSMDFGRPEVTPSWTFSWIFITLWWVTHHTFHTKHKAFTDFPGRKNNSSDLRG